MKLKLVKIPKVAQVGFDALVNLAKDAPFVETVQDFGKGVYRISRNNQVFEYKDIYQNDSIVDREVIRIPDFFKPRYTNRFTTYVQNYDGIYVIASKTKTERGHFLKVRVEAGVENLDSKKFSSILKFIEGVVHITDQWKKIFGGSPFRMEQVQTIAHTLTKNDLVNLDDYALSVKADGVRFLLMIDEITAFVRPPYTAKYVSNFSGKQTVVDGELVESKNLYIAFDMLVDNGSDIRSLPLMERMARLNARKADLIRATSFASKKYTFLIKEQFTQKTFSERIEKVLSMKMTYPQDGIVFTNLGKYDNRVLKWKPVTQLTVDFVLVHDKADEYVPYVTDRNRKLVPFKGTRLFPFTGIVRVSTRISTKVVEVVWDGSNFKVSRPRPDKAGPNSDQKAGEVWKAINSPITENDLLGETRMIPSKWHTEIKSAIISSLGQGKTVLDIGAGVGGDIAKWKKIDATVDILEPNKEHTLEYAKRAQDFGIQTSKIGHFYLGENSPEEIVKFYGKEYDIIALFFSMTFLFRTTKTLQNAVNTMDALLGPKGVIVGTFTDGLYVQELLPKPEDSFNGGFYEYKRNGQEITVTIQSGIVGQQQIEYIVNFEKFANLLEERGIQICTYNRFNELPFFDQEQATFSRLNSWFVATR